MEVEEYLGRSRLFRRLRSGPHGQPVERYAARLVEETASFAMALGGVSMWSAGS